MAPTARCRALPSKTVPNNFTSCHVLAGLRLGFRLIQTEMGDWGLGAYCDIYFKERKFSKSGY